MFGKMFSDMISTHTSSILPFSRTASVNLFSSGQICGKCQISYLFTGFTTWKFISVKMYILANIHFFFRVGMNTIFINTRQCKFQVFNHGYLI